MTFPYKLRKCYKAKKKKRKKKKEKENGKILHSTVLLIFIKVILSKGKMEITGFCSKQNS